MNGSLPATGFFDLPIEIRSEIYKHLVSSNLNKFPDPTREGHMYYKFNLQILRVNHQIHDEAIEILRRQNVFIHIDTPWAQAIEHVAVEGRVPVLAQGLPAAAFKHAHLRVAIDAPRHGFHASSSNHFLTTLDDLDTFCQFWFYQGLSYPGVNEALRLTLTVANPSPRPWSPTDENLPVEMQRKLLLPFGKIKGLDQCIVRGKVDEDVKKELRAEQELPYESPQSCLEKCAKLKDCGNTELKAGNPLKAIEFYVKAWHSIHIVVEGRRRMVWAEPFFIDSTFDSGPFKGQETSFVRIILRITLVANTILAYLNAKEYEEAAFWGKRSIDTMREHFGNRANVPNFAFPAAETWGKVFYRTGIACKNLNQMSEYKEFIAIAGDWLPNDSIVAKEKEEAGVGTRVPRMLG